jgi:sugar phosphate isomerase/epimerase
MEFAISTHLFVGERLTAHVLDQILAAGFRKIEIFGARQHLDYHDKNQVRDVAQWFRDHGLALHSLHAPLYADLDWGRSGGSPLSIAYLERRLRIDSMEEIKRAIDVAELLPFRYVIQHMGLAGEEYNLTKFDAALTSLEHLRIYAKERGAEVLLENIPNELSTPERLTEFIHYAHLTGQKICFDTGHAHMGQGVTASFEALKDRVASTHVHDNRREKDDHLMPFDGTIDWNETVKALRSRDGQLPILFELRNYGPEVSSLSRLGEVMRRLEAIR